MVARDDLKNTESGSSNTKRLGELMQQLLANPAYLQLPQPMQRYILSHANMLLNQPSATVAMVTNQVRGMIETARTNLTEHEKQNSEKLKTNTTLNQQTSEFNNLSFQQLAQAIKKQDQVFNFYAGESEKLDEWRKKNPAWTIEDMNNASPEALQKHLAKLQAEIAIRDIAIRNEQEALKQKEELLKAMARDAGIPGSSLSDIRKYIDTLSPEQQNGKFKEISSAIADYDKQEQHITSQKDILKSVKDEYFKAEAIRTNRGIAAPDKQQIDAALADIQREVNIDGKLIAKAKEEIDAATQERTIKEQQNVFTQQLNTEIDVTMKALCEMIRDKIPGISENATPKEYMAIIKANANLLQNSDIALVYDELKTAYPEKDLTNNKALSSLSADDQQLVSNISKTIESSQKALNNSNSPIEKNWVQSVAPKTEQQTSRSNGGIRI